MQASIHPCGSAFGVSGMLLGFFVVSLVSGTAQAQIRDHYQCYRAKQRTSVCQENLTTKCNTDADCQTICLQKFASRNVSLTDPFGSASTQVKKPKSLCAPVEKNPQGPPAQDPALHYKRYQVKGGPSVKGLRVLARDQFGDHVIELLKADSLYVPALKSDTPIPPPAPGPNHYLCYKARNKKKICTDNLTTRCKLDADCTQGGICDLGFGKVPQGLTDQFGSSTVEIKKVKFFCTPVDKNGEGTGDPENHLIGYQIKGSRINATVHTNDQFGPEGLALSKPEILFVPAEKNPGPLPSCGDGNVNQPSEDCDPPDDAACTSQCQPDCTCPVPPRCGDGMLNQASEDCDPPDDAACTGQCQPDCTCPPPPRCGDGNVNQVSEDCDPPEDAACVDQCQPNCTCPGAEPRCGDGAINQPSEQCDDGNTQNGDCCSASCEFESCDDGNACTDDSCNPASGCVYTNNSDPCDDGDPCTDPDQCQDGSCVGSPVCGDGVVQGACGEECDGTDAAACPGDCQQNCACPVCGDGLVNQTSEQCDPPDESACPGECKENCTCPVCGDGVVNQASEQCDPPEDSACLGECRAGCVCPCGRTVFAGGPKVKACQQFVTQATCEMARHVGLLGDASCYWATGNLCKGCGVFNERQGECTNTCTPPIVCDDLSRTRLVFF